MAEVIRTDAVVIGSGPGGYPAGIRLGQLGVKTIVIEKGQIANYQLVVPSTRNASPRDAQGQRSPYEASLIGTPVHDPTQPLEILRTVHSFDPCLACSTHVMSEDGQEMADIRVR